jgi:hypothetical protein
MKPLHRKRITTETQSHREVEKQKIIMKKRRREVRPQRHRDTEIERECETDGEKKE